MKRREEAEIILNVLAEKNLLEKTEIANEAIEEGLKEVRRKKWLEKESLKNGA